MKKYLVASLAQGTHSKVMSRHKKESNKDRLDILLGRKKEAVRRCAMKGCSEEGVYPAPRSRREHDYYWFCLEHVRAYNKEWNYFANCSEGFIKAYNRAAMVGMRPTWRFGGHPHATPHVNVEGMGFDFSHKPATPPLPQKTQQALTLLSLRHDCSLAELKRQYRHMVKLNHPDLQGTNKKNEQKMSELNQAYRHLQEYIDKRKT